MKNIIFLSVLTISLLGCGNTDKQADDMKNKNGIEFINPEGLNKNPAFSQVAVVHGNYKTVYIGGQNSVDKDGNIVGKGNLEEQAKQILNNLQTALKSGGADFENIVKWNIYSVKGQSPEKALKVFQEPMSKLKNPPLITMIYVESLANPDFLMEIEAIAIVPEK